MNARPARAPRSAALALAAALLALGCSSSGTTDPTPPGVDVTIQPGAQSKGAAAFAPSPFTVSIAAGGTVKWRNGDVGTSGDVYGAGGTPGTTHAITSDTPGEFAQTLAPGATFEHTFTTAGTIHYHCSIHPTMTGIIVVNP